jgi:hypothetical protein
MRADPSAVSDERIQELVARGALRRVAPDRDAAGRELLTAKQHLESSRVVAGTDQTAALALAYEAARKAIAAHMRANGLRIGGGEGGHARMGEYGLAAFDDPELAERFRGFDRVRQLRNRSQYDAFFVEDADVRYAFEQAEGIVAAVEAELA